MWVSCAVQCCLSQTHPSQQHPSLQDRGWGWGCTLAALRKHSRSMVTLGWVDRLFFASRSCQNRKTHGLKLILSAFWLELHSVCLPPITRSIACSKCFWFMESERCLAAIRAASLQTLATSAPTKWMYRTAYPPNILELIRHTLWITISTVSFSTSSRLNRV